jgi:hypothetical protein
MVGNLSNSSAQTSQAFEVSRAISPKFFADLETGILASLPKKVQRDDTLMLALRGNYINIYYRGGSILKLTERKSGGYDVCFDTDYSKGTALALPQPSCITKPEHCDTWVAALPALKEVMNHYFSDKRKAEREFQQLVAWENNRSVISSDTEYFITDIEYAVTLDGRPMRADMLGLKWPAGKRSGSGECTPVIIEMKYGIKAFKGSSTAGKKGSGIKDHFDDICSFFGVDGNEDKSKVKKREADFKKMIALQFQQLWKLKLIRFDESRAFKEAKGLPKITGKPEVVFLLANNNPRSTALGTAIRSIPDSQIEKAEPHFDLRFFAASFAGYGMHDACMLTRNQVLEQLNSARAVASTFD